MVPPYLSYTCFVSDGSFTRLKGKAMSFATKFRLTCIHLSYLLCTPSIPLQNKALVIGTIRCYLFQWDLFVDHQRGNYLINVTVNSLESCAATLMTRLILFYADGHHGCKWLLVFTALNKNSMTKTFFYGQGVLLPVSHNDGTLS